MLSIANLHTLYDNLDAFQKMYRFTIEFTNQLKNHNKTFLKYHNNC